MVSKVDGQLRSVFEPGAKITVGFDLDCIWYLILMPRFQLGLILLFTAVFTGEVPLSLVSMNSFDLIDRGSISLTMIEKKNSHAASYCWL